MRGYSTNMASVVNAMNWKALDIVVEPEAREAVEYALMEAGALGTETTDTNVIAYFSDIPNRELIRSELFEALRIYSLPSSSVRDMSLREVENRVEADEIFAPPEECAHEWEQPLT